MLYQKQGKLFSSCFTMKKMIWKRNKQTNKKWVLSMKVTVKYHSINYQFSFSFNSSISKAVLSPSPAALLESPFSVAGATSVELPLKNRLINNTDSIAMSSLKDPSRNHCKSTNPGFSKPWLRLIFARTVQEKIYLWNKYEDFPNITPVP